MKLQTQLDEMRKGSDAEDSRSLADGVEASQSIEETSPLVKCLGAEVDDYKTKKIIFFFLHSFFLRISICFCSFW
jgi:hypothetical protein